MNRMSLVRTERLELSHLSILEPKSSASTNSATSAARSKHQVKPLSSGRIIPNRPFLPSIASAVSSVASSLYYLDFCNDGGK